MIVWLKLDRFEPAGNVAEEAENSLSLLDRGAHDKVAKHLGAAQTIGITGCIRCRVCDARARNGPV
eukprot:5584553-Prymnesium_polylepis.1